MRKAEALNINMEDTLIRPSAKPAAWAGYSHRWPSSRWVKSSVRFYEITEIGIRTNFWPPSDLPCGCVAANVRVPAIRVGIVR